MKRYKRRVWKRGIGYTYDGVNPTPCQCNLSSGPCKCGKDRDNYVPKHRKGD